MPPTTLGDRARIFRNAYYLTFRNRGQIATEWRITFEGRSICVDHPIYDYSRYDRESIIMMRSNFTRYNFW